MLSKRTLCDVLEAMADEKLVAIRALQEPKVTNKAQSMCSYTSTCVYLWMYTIRNCI